MIEIISLSDVRLSQDRKLLDFHPNVEGFDKLKITKELVQYFLVEYWKTIFVYSNSFLHVLKFPIKFPL